MFDKVIDMLDKARSRVYGVYIFWLGIGFSPVIFTSIFVDQNLIFNKTGMLKNEYIRQEYFDFSQPLCWLYIIAIFIGSGIMTRLAIWDFPKWFVNRSYQQELNSLFTKEEMLLRKEQDLEKKRYEIAQKKVDTVEKEKAADEKRQIIEEREEDRWKREYGTFKKSSIYNSFYLITESVYQRHGAIKVTNSYSGETRFEIPTDLVSYADGNGLIDVDVQKAIISLTKKGKYFMTRYQEDKIIKK